MPQPSLLQDKESNSLLAELATIQASSKLPEEKQALFQEKAKEDDEYGFLLCLYFELWDHNEHNKMDNSDQYLKFMRETMSRSLEITLKVLQNECLREKIFEHSLGLSKESFEQFWKKCIASNEKTKQEEATPKQKVAIWFLENPGYIFKVSVDEKPQQEFLRGIMITHSRVASCILPITKTGERTWDDILQEFSKSDNANDLRSTLMNNILKRAGADNVLKFLEQKKGIDFLNSLEEIHREASIKKIIRMKTIRSALASEPDLLNSLLGKQSETKAMQAICIWEIIQKGEKDIIGSLLANPIWKQHLNQVVACVDSTDVKTERVIGQIKAKLGEFNSVKGIQETSVESERSDLQAMLAENTVSPKPRFV